MQFLNGSQILVIPAVSANLTGTGGSSNAFNLAGYQGAMVIGSTGSNGGGTTGVTFKAVRSATSNGTFNFFGFSASGLSAGSGNTVVRSFMVNTSATWHKIVYNNNGGGSYSPHAYVLAQRNVYEPIPTQATNVITQDSVLFG